MQIDNLDIKKRFYHSLNERQRRHYAAQLVLDLGRGGTELVSTSFGINPKTIRQGIKELQTQDHLPAGRVRRAGGGRKKT